MSSPTKRLRFSLPRPEGPIDCSGRTTVSEEWLERSQLSFLESRTWDQIVDLWNLFYLDELCLPGNQASWSSREWSNVSVFDTDPHEMAVVGKRIAAISRASGILFDDGQAGSVSLGQRQYLTGFAPVSQTPQVKRIVQEVNRFPGLVAFWFVDDTSNHVAQDSDPEEDEDEDLVAEEPPNTLQGLAVTYPEGPVTPVTREISSTTPPAWRGSPKTFLSNVSPVTLELRNWLNPSLREELWEEGLGFLGVVFLDTHNGRSDLLLSVLEMISGLA